MAAASPASRSRASVTMSSSPPFASRTYYQSHHGTSSAGTVRHSPEQQHPRPHHHHHQYYPAANQIFLRPADDDSENVVRLDGNLDSTDRSQSYAKPDNHYRRSVLQLSPGSAPIVPRHGQHLNTADQPASYDHLRRKSYNPYDRTGPIPNATISPSAGQQTAAPVSYLGHRASITGSSGRLQSSARLSPRLVSSGTASSSTVTSASTAAMSANTNMTDPPAHSMKVVVVGDGGCGKTCLLISYSKGVFPEKYVPTVFENYITQTPHPETQKVVELALWDTAGQEEYDRLRPLSYPETDLVIICFAVDCPNSLENVQDKWYPEVMHFLPTQPIMLVGLKTDRRDDRDCLGMLKSQGLVPVSPEQGQQMAVKIGATYMECSSKMMDRIDDVFDTAIRIAVGKGQSSSMSEPSEPESVARKRRARSRCVVL